MQYEDGCPLKFPDMHCPNYDKPPPQAPAPCLTCDGLPPYCHNAPCRPTSAKVYEQAPPSDKARIDAIITDLEQKIKANRKPNDRRTHQEPVEFDRRHGDRRHRNED